LEIRDIQEKLETLSSRIDNLESLSSKNKNNDELQVVTSEQPSDVANRQEQQVFTFLSEYLFIQKQFLTKFFQNILRLQLNKQSGQKSKQRPLSISRRFQYLASLKS